MSPFIRILLGVAVMVVGFCFVRYSDKVLEWFGRVDFAEDKLGQGGTRLFYKLMGILIAFIGMFIATNIMSDILGGFAGLFSR